LEIQFAALRFALGDQPKQECADAKNQRAQHPCAPIRECEQNDGDERDANDGKQIKFRFGFLERQAERFEKPFVQRAQTADDRAPAFVKAKQQ
jgi:hypothetical protein